MKKVSKGKHTIKKEEIHTVYYTKEEVYRILEDHAKLTAGFNENMEFSKSGMKVDPKGYTITLENPIMEKAIADVSKVKSFI